MDTTSRSSKGFIAWIICGGILALSLMIGISLLLLTRYRWRKDTRNKAYTEAVELEQRRPPQPSSRQALEELERREQERESRWQKLVSRFGNSGATVDDVEAQARPVRVKPLPPKPTSRMPSQLRSAKKLPYPKNHPMWPGQAQADNVIGEAGKTRQANSVTESVPLESHARRTKTLPPVSPQRQARLAAQRERIFQQREPLGRDSRQPSWSETKKVRTIGTGVLRKI